MQSLNDHELESFVKNIVGKGEKSGKQHFFSFPTMFSRTDFSICPPSNLSSANALDLN